MLGLTLACLALCISAVRGQKLSNVLYEKLILPDDKTYSVFLRPGEVVTMFYLLQKDVQTLSMTVTPCSIAVSWELDYRNSNQTGRVDVGSGRGSHTLSELAYSDQRHRLVSPARKGLYTIRLSSEESGWVELYATFLGTPGQLWPSGKMTAKSRPSKGNVFFRWSRTTVDPDQIDYVLVVHNSSIPVRTLCQAKEEHQLSGNNNHTIMEKTGQRTNWLVKGLEPKKVYSAEVFAVNRVTNFSYRFADLGKIMYSRPKPRPLVDGLQVVADLRVHEPTVLYRYKVRKADITKLEVGVTACGEGTLIAEVKKRGSNIEDQRTIKGHGVLIVQKPVLKAVYVIKLKLPPDSGPVSAQVMVKGNELEEPILPEPAQVHEFKGLRGCRNVTLGWVPVNGDATYCLRAIHSKRKDILRREPDQCTVEQQLNSLGYSVLQCSRIQSSDKKVVSETLTNLRPGKQYDIQLSVKKANSKRLSYKLVRVRTKPTCT